MVKKLANRMFSIVLMMMLMTTLSLKVNAGNVTVKGGITNGTVTVDKTTANPGETVTITVTPDGGYYAEKANVKAEKTIDGGSAQVPGLKADNSGPGVGSFVEIQGNEPDDVSATATYTFTMPEAPFGVQVSAVFQDCTPITASMIEAIANQEYTGSAITPAVVVKNGDNTLTLDTDYTVEYSNNTELGQAIVTVTGKGKYTGTATVNFTIYRETYEVRWGIGETWPEEHVIAMTEDADGNWVAADQDMVAASQFKVVRKYEDGGIEPTLNWYGTPDNSHYWITETYIANPQPLSMQENTPNIYIEKAGTYTFTFTPSETNPTLVVTGKILHSVTVADGIQNGTVVADPTSGYEGDPITITATPANGYKLTHLYINGEQVIGTQNEDGTYTYTFTMPASDVTVDATFALKLYTITIANTEHGTVDVSMTQGYMGDEIGIQVSPDEGYTVDQITVTTEDGTQVEVTDMNTFFMPASNVTITVTFRALNISYEVRWGKTVGDSWETENVIPMTKDETTGKWVAANQAMDAASEFKIVKKVQDGNNEPDLTWYGTPTNDGSKYWITAAYLADPQTLSMQENTPNIYIERSGTYTFTFTPSQTNPTLVVTGTLLYNINIDDTEHGSVTTTPVGPVTAGTEVTINATPDEGYEINTITVMNGDTQVNVENNKFIMPAGDVTVNVTFKEIVVEYFYEVVEEVKCIVTGNPDGPAGLAQEGQNITMRIVPDSNTKLKEVVVNKVTGSGPEQVVEAIEHTITVSEAGDIDLSFVMPAADVEIHVICADAYAITVNAGDNGSASADMLVAYENEIVTVTTSPNLEYKVDEIYYTYMVDNEEQRGELTEGENGVYTLSMPAAPVTVVVTFKTIIDYYKLKFDAENAGGTVSVIADGNDINSMDNVAEFSQVRATVTPAEGYEIESFNVYEGIVNADDDLTETHEVSYNIVDGVYVFEMPRTDATILVSFKQIQVELEGVAFTADRKWATYYNGTKNLALPEGIQAYVVTGVANEAVVIDEIDYIPAAVGVLLYSEIAAEQVMTTVYNGETDSYTSMLVGSDEAQTITSGYVLYNNNFIRSEEGTVAAHRCYLPATQVSGAPRFLKIGLNDVPTAIESIIAQGNVAGIKYVNLNGMTSNEPFRGINIAVITFTDGSTTTVKVVK